MRNVHLQFVSFRNFFFVDGLSLIVPDFSGIVPLHGFCKLNVDAIVCRVWEKIKINLGLDKYK